MFYQNRWTVQNVDWSWPLEELSSHSERVEVDELTPVDCCDSGEFAVFHCSKESLLEIKKTLQIWRTVWSWHQVQKRSVKLVQNSSTTIENAKSAN